jgi:hypothetical protein
LQERLAAEHIPAMIVVQYPGHSYIRRRQTSLESQEAGHLVP